MKTINLAIIASTILLLSIIFVPLFMKEGEIVDYTIENAGNDSDDNYYIRIVIENSIDRYIAFPNRDYEYVYDQCLKLKNNK